MFPFLYAALGKLGDKNGSGQLNCKEPLGCLLSSSGDPANLGGAAGDTFISFRPGALGRMPVPAETASGPFWTKQDRNKTLASISTVAQLTFTLMSWGERFVQLPQVTCCLMPHWFCCAAIFGRCLFLHSKWTVRSERHASAAQPVTSLNRLTWRSANGLEHQSLVETLMPADRLPLSDVRAGSQQTSCLLGRTFLSHPLPASFWGVCLFVFLFWHPNPHVDLTWTDGNAS